jgi:hypothetical protein
MHALVCILHPIHAYKVDQTGHKGVYALCCANMGYLLMFEIYAGKGSTPDSSPKGVISRLLHGAGAMSTTGHILYTDNFYMSL